MDNKLIEANNKFVEKVFFNTLHIKKDKSHYNEPVILDNSTIKNTNIDKLKIDSDVLVHSINLDTIKYLDFHINSFLIVLILYNLLIYQI